MSFRDINIRSIKFARVRLLSTLKVDLNWNHIMSVLFEFEVESLFASPNTFLVLLNAFLFRRCAVETPRQVFLIMCQAIGQTSTEQFRLRIDFIAGARRSGCTRQNEENQQLQKGQRLWSAHDAVIVLW